jgi:NADPH:quinone reductase-like Zn-dependent oxidoreductase
MKAIAIEKYGSIEEMRFQELPIPNLGAADVLIEVHAAAVNPVDIAIRNGWLQERISYRFPLVLGWDVAGIVKAVGDQVCHFKIGDEVYSSPALSRNGSYAEFISVDERFVAKKPINSSFLEAASVPLVGITAYRGLVELAKVQQGQKVLILGGAGGVGTFAVQLAKSLGAYVVTTTSTKNMEFVKSLGADEVLDYTVTELDGYDGEMDIIFDTVGRKSFERSLGLVKEGGKMISIASFFTEEDKIFAKERDFSLEFFFSEPSGEILSIISNLIEGGTVKPVIGTIFALEDAPKAHELSETKHARGKIVLQVKST